MEVREFENQWAIILGGSGAIGFATAAKLASKGMNLCLVHRDMGEVKTVFNQAVQTLKDKANVEIVTFNKDATQQGVIEEVLEHFKTNDFKIAVFLHGLARGNVKSLLEEENSLQAEDFSITVQAMGYSLHTWVKAIYNQQLFADQAVVFGLTSEGNQKYIPGYTAVGASKVLLEKIVKDLAVELAPHGVRCNIIQAGVIDSRALRMIPNAEKIIEIAQKRNPMGRLTSPEDVANAIYVFSKPESNWINGGHIHVDGGEHLN